MRGKQGSAYLGVLRTGTTHSKARLALPSGLVEAALGCVAVTAAAFSQGAYYPTAWGFFTIAAVWG